MNSHRNTVTARYAPRLCRIVGEASGLSFHPGSSRPTRPGASPRVAQAAGLEQEMMRSGLQPPKQVSLCAIAAALMLSFLLSGPAAGVTQRYCPTRPHSGRHDGNVRRRGRQICE
jgi:hypothetical protein